MSVTEAVFHLEMSSLNVDLSLNTPLMVVTALVSQSPIAPYVPVAADGLLTHAVAAVAMVASVMLVSA
jgi:hypothetical protein